MHSLTKMTSRYWYRSRLFWTLLIVTVYAFVGFFVLPGIIKSTAIEQIKANLGWEASIEKVELNPFALSLTIHHLNIQDQQGDSVISFERYNNNIELRSITEGAITFSKLELIAPYIKLIINKDGKTNLQTAIESNSPPTNTEDKPSSDTSIIKMVFDYLSVAQGEIHVENNTLLEPIVHTLKPVDFTLRDFSTFVNKEGAYELDIELDKGRKLSWKGSLNIAPLHSSGTLKVENIRAHRFWAYAKNNAPYHLSNALVGIEGRYKVDSRGDDILLEIDNATITVDDLKLATTPTAEPFLGINQIIVGPLDFNLNEQALDISRLSVDGIDLAINRDNEGKLAMLAPLEKMTDSGDATPEPEPSETQESNPFEWRVGDFSINNSQLKLSDQQPKTAANITVSNINTSLAGLSNDMSKSLDFSLSYLLENSGKSEVSGQLIPAPLNLKAKLNIDDFALSTIQPYLNEQVRMSIKEGALSIRGDINLEAPANGESMDGGFNGVISFNQLDTTDQVANERLFGWKSLIIDPINVNFNPLSISIEDIRFEAPYSRILVTKEGSTNLASLAVTPASPANESSTPNTAPPKDSTGANSDPMPITINRILLNNGAVYFADASLNPGFSTSIENINGEISGLSSDNLAKANVDIKGTIEEYGKLMIKGKMNPLGSDLYTDLAVNFDNIELAAFTPYTGKYIGQAIDKGKLTLDLNYKIAQRELKGDNRLVIDQLQLGRDIESKDAVSLPLDLALAVLKTPKGVIDIDLPTHGNLDDPNFKISGLVLKALLNVINKAATAPFSMIGNLVGGNGDELSTVDFTAGSHQLTKDQQEKLAILSKALKDRPQLMLEIRAMVDQEVDGFALKKLKLSKTLNTDSPRIGAPHIKGMEKLFISRSGQPALQLIKASAVADKQHEANYSDALYNALIKTESLTELELTELAQKRINIIKTQLINVNSIPNGQIFSLDPSLEGKASGDTVTTQFSLSTR